MSEPGAAAAKCVVTVNLIQLGIAKEHRARDLARHGQWVCACSDCELVVSALGESAREFREAPEQGHKRSQHAARPK